MGLKACRGCVCETNTLIGWLPLSWSLCYWLFKPFIWQKKGGGMLRGTCCRNLWRTLFRVNSQQQSFWTLLSLYVWLTTGRLVSCNQSQHVRQKGKLTCHSWSFLWVQPKSHTAQVADCSFKNITESLITSVIAEVCSCDSLPTKMMRGLQSWWSVNTGGRMDYSGW